MELRKRKIGNESSPSASKFLKGMVRVREEDDDDSQDEIDDQNQNQNQNALNPLFMTEILPTIFNHLDIGNLKNARFVCLFWGLEGGKILLKNSNLKLKCFATKVGPTPEKIERLDNFLNTGGTSATLNSIINKANSDTDRLQKIFPRIFQQTSSLQLNPRSFRSTDHTALAKFLEFFPNLQILRLGDRWGYHDATKVELLNKFESLREIRLEFYERFHYSLTNLLVNKKELAVKEIHVRGHSPFFREYLESECNWPIETLVLAVGESFSPELLNTVQLFLEKISGTLKHLGWHLTGPQTLSAEFLVPWANNLINPAALARLETLFIFCKEWNSSASASDFSWLLFTFALQLGNLKKLTVNKVPKNLEAGIRKWNKHPNASGRTLKSESLEELDIFQELEDRQKIGCRSIIMFSCTLWPNLKFLLIENPPNTLPKSVLLSDWINLERLDLKFEKMNKKNALIWTKWLTGGESSSQYDSTFTLQDLTELKHFGLWESRREGSTRIATDFLADNILKSMTQLQSLYLENSKISREVKKMLKETLGPKVEIVFQVSKPN